MTRENMMKAIIQVRYGSPDVLRLKDIEKPAVKDDEALVRVQAAAVNIGEWHLLRGMPYVMRLVSGVLKPSRQVPGLDIAGTVEEVGRNVRHLRPGDEVFGRCKRAFAEYACAPENNLLPKPANLTFEQSAAVGDSAFTALAAVRDQGKVQSGQKVLINGASGGVGTFAVQIAKSYGAHVTGVCSTRNFDLVRSIGADRVIDYTQDDFTQTEQNYDVMLDLVGSRSLSDCRRVLTRRGTYVLVGVSNMGRRAEGRRPGPDAIETRMGRDSGSRTQYLASGPARCKTRGHDPLSRTLNCTPGRFTPPNPAQHSRHIKPSNHHICRAFDGHGWA
jgi:NADPH:quinone reductase-like Zn-dependent oxidoreductase